MEAASLPAAGHHHHGPPPANQSSRVSPAMLGMLLFIISEIMVFGAFFTAYFFIRVVVPDADWFPIDGLKLPAGIAGMNTAILLSSSVTLHWALTAVKRDDRRGMKVGMALTWLLGLSFLFIQINEYATITREGITPDSSAAATVFYGLTGLHGAHVFIGLLLLTIVTIRVFRGHFSAKDHEGMEVPGIYWHFVDVMWIVVYTTVYLL